MEATRVEPTTSESGEKILSKCWATSPPALVINYYSPKHLFSLESILIWVEKGLGLSPNPWSHTTIPYDHTHRGFFNSHATGAKT
jgi:hypothetical protein